MPQCIPSPFLSLMKLVIELNRILSSTPSFPEGTPPPPHKARQRSQEESPLLEHDLFGAYNPVAPRVAGGGGRQYQKRRRRAKAVGTGWQLLAGWSGQEPWQVQTEV